MTKELFYKNGSDYFGVNFPLGIDANELATKLEVANKKIGTEKGENCEKTEPCVSHIGSLKGNRTPI